MEAPPPPAVQITEMPTPPLCMRQTTIGPLGLAPNRPADYLEFGHYSGFQAERYRGQFTVAGSECLSAPDVAACRAELAAQLEAYCRQTLQWDACAFPYLATTHGERVQISAETTGIVRALLPIDTAQEALLAASFTGRTIPCEDNAVRAVVDGYELYATRGGCIDDKVRCLLHVDISGAITEQSCTILVPRQENCVIGRRPAGLCPPRTSLARHTAAALGRYLADAAQLEAASIHAFRVLRDELRAHRAPAALPVAAEVAARDEIRHAVITAALARRFAGQPLAPRIERRPLRPLAALAEENMVEGCVRETFGALVAHFQAARAAEPLLRSAMKQIAEDETHHAALAWQVAAWAQRELCAATRAQLGESRRRAIRTLRTELLNEPAPELAHQAGLPSSREAMALLEQVDKELWTQAG